MEHSKPQKPFSYSFMLLSTQFSQSQYNRNPMNRNLPNFWPWMSVLKCVYIHIKKMRFIFHFLNVPNPSSTDIFTSPQKPSINHIHREKSSLNENFSYPNLTFLLSFLLFFSFIHSTYRTIQWKSFSCIIMMSQSEVHCNMEVCRILRWLWSQFNHCCCCKGQSLIHHNHHHHPLHRHHHSRWNFNVKKMKC